MRSRKDRAMSDFAESDFADDPRAALDRLLRERRIDYAELSARIDRNPAYIQQYIKRGPSRRLAEEDPARLAAYPSSDERRVAQECCMWCRSRWAPCHKQKNNKTHSSI